MRKGEYENGACVRWCHPAGAREVGRIKLRAACGAWRVEFSGRLHVALNSSVVGLLMSHAKTRRCEALAPKERTAIGQGEALVEWVLI
jgi:hypothetical protein